MIRTLLCVSLSSLSLLLPSHQTYTGKGDGIVSHHVYAKTVVLKTPPLPSQESLQLVYLNKLRPYGTYANDYAPGNCTAFVASRLPIPNNWGNANSWAYSASLAGYTVSSVPRAGEIAQTSGDSWLGHVAVVESVNPDGSFIISEMNFNGLFSIDTRPATTAEFPNFIYI